MRMMLWLFLVASVSWAGPKSGAKPPPPAPKTVVAPFDPRQPSGALLARARELFTSLEYEQVAAVTEVLLTREDLLLEQRIEVLKMRGSVLAIIADPVDAELPFRLLLRAAPDSDFPADTAPKILGVFRKVQAEEQAAARQLRELERSRVVSTLKLVSELPTSATGGLPLKFAVRVKDPTTAVELVKVPYRRQGQSSFSVLALDHAEDGSWRGSIPADFMADEKGFTLEYYVETADKAGLLLTEGSASGPRQLAVSAGVLARPLPVSRGAFIGSAAVTVITGLAAGGLGLGFNAVQSRYRLLGSQGADATQLLQEERLGTGLATATTVGLITAAVSLVVTLVLAPLTDFAGPPVTTN